MDACFTCGSSPLPQTLYRAALCLVTIHALVTDPLGASPGGGDEPAAIVW